MRTCRLPTKHASVATRCQQWEGEETSSEQVLTGLQSWPPVITNGGLCTVRSHVQGVGWGIPCTVRSHVGRGGVRVLGGPLYSEVQYIIGNGHMGSPSVNRMHMSVGRVQGVPCTVGSNASWVIVTWDPPCVNRMTDRQDWKHYLPATSLAGGNNIVCVFVKIISFILMTISTLRRGKGWSKIEVTVTYMFALYQCELTYIIFYAEVVMSLSTERKAGKSSSWYYEIILAVPSSLSIYQILSFWYSDSTQNATFLEQNSLMNAHVHMNTKLHKCFLSHSHFINEISHNFAGQSGLSICSSK